MKKFLLFYLLSFAFCLITIGQPQYDMKRLHHEKLGRGVVAIKKDTATVIVSWRTLASDIKGEAFDVYRNGLKLNDKPLTTGGTFFVDQHPIKGTAVYEIKGGGMDGSFKMDGNAPAGYLPIKIEKPADGITPDGRKYSYSANDASIGDVDGDGNYEIFLKWEPTNAADNSRGGFTGNVFIDCYRLTGERLWRIDLGRNIRAGAHFTQFLVYDFDCDGRAEMIVRTSDGTRDGMGRVIGDSTADYRENIDAKTSKIHDNKTGRILKGKEYVTVFDGETGAALKSVDYIPERGDVRSWGDDHANRSDRFLACVAYLDGCRPSAVMCRGYYTRTVLAAWDWDGKELKSRWIFDTNNPQWKDYAGQGNHNLRVADVDGDGCDEITYGSMAVDHDGKGLYNTHMGHGDAIHLTAFNPRSRELQVWDCHENRCDGSDFRDAKTGKVIFQLKDDEDVGRCMAADIDPNNPGVEMWSTASNGIRNMDGDVLMPRNERIARYDDLSTALSKDDNTTMAIPNLRGVRMPTNFGIWWDGDLLRELLDKERVSKYDWNSGIIETVERFDGIQFNNWTKQNPCLSADIIGDWREEVLARTPDSSELRLYVTTIPTDFRINCLEEDIPYRLSVAHENVGYNQPPETGFYLGPDETVNPFLK